MLNFIKVWMYKKVDDICECGLFKSLKEWNSNKTKREHTKHAAYKLLNDEAFLIAKESYQESLLHKWVSTKPDETEKREELKRQYDTVDKVVYELSVLYNLEEEEEDDGKT